MAVTAHVFTMLEKSQIDKKCDLDSDTLKAMLLSAYTPNQDAHQFVSDVKAAGTEAAGTGYTAGGKTLTNVTFTKSGHVWTLDCDDFSWDATGGTLSAAYLVFYDATPGTDATNPVIAFWDLGGTQTASNGLFPVTISASGLYANTAS